MVFSTSNTQFPVEDVVPLLETLTSSPSNGFVDPDDIGISNSPPLKPMRLNLIRPVPSLPSQGDAVLASFMTGGAVSRTDQGEGGIGYDESANYCSSSPGRQAKSPSSSIGSSVRKGRSGWLNSFVAIAEKAVKAVGACWSCRILRKSVSIEPIIRLRHFILKWLLWKTANFS
jgi:hypothetical protein